MFSALGSRFWGSLMQCSHHVLHVGTGFKVMGLMGLHPSIIRRK